MKKLLLLLVIPALLAAGLIWAYRKMSQEREVGKVIETPVRAESRIKRVGDGGVVITLNPETQKRIDLTTASLTLTNQSRDLKAYGRVLDPAPIAALLVDLATAKAALEASGRELQRVKTLAESQNTSARTVETAEAACRRDQIAVEAIQWRLIAGWGKSLAGHPDLPALVRSLTARETALVRLDLPAGENAAPPPAARVFALASADKPLPAEYLGPAPDIDSQAQGLGFFFLVKSGADSLHPGQALLGLVQQPGQPLTGVVVPPSAVIRAAGKAWVYLQTSPTNFARRDILLDYPAEMGWLVTSGLRPGDRLVVTGAQMLFSEELKSKIQFGD